MPKSKHQIPGRVRSAYEFIKAHRDQYSVQMLCRVLLYADMSANSGNNFLTRDPDFAARFLERHQDKLMFGSGDTTGRCVARATLTELQKLASPSVFKKNCLGQRKQGDQDMNR